MSHIWFDQESGGFYENAESPNSNCVKVTKEMRDFAIAECSKFAYRKLVVSKTGKDYATLGLAPLFSDKQMLTEFVRMARERLTATIEALSQTLQKVGSGEANTFETKYQAAIAFLHAQPNPAQIIMLDTEAKLAGRTSKDLAETIQKKYEAYITKTAVISGLRQLGEAQISNLTTWQDAEVWFTKFVKEQKATIDTVVS